MSSPPSRLAHSEARYRRLFETARDGILLLNAATGQIDDVNPYLIELLGYSHAEFLGKKLWEVGPFADAEQSKQMFEQLQLQGYIRYDTLPLRTRAGRTIEVEFVSNSYDCEGVRVIQCNVRDISERRRIEQLLQRLAFEDPLTGLANRRLLLDRLQHAVGACSRNHSHGAVVFIDLDRFKVLNDALGHAAGDELLVEVARRLLQVVRSSDTVSRFGGDEFVILLEQLDSDAMSARESVDAVVRKVQQSLSTDYQLAGQRYQGGCSMGVQIFGPDDRDADRIISAADVEMYANKRRNGHAKPPWVDPLVD